MVDLTNESPCENCMMDPDDTCECVVSACFMDLSYDDLVEAGCSHPTEVAAYIDRAIGLVAGRHSS